MAIPRKALPATLAAVFAAAGAGCTETIPSELVRTGRITALMSATAVSGESCTVRVELRDGGKESSTFVVVGGGDVLSARAGEEERKLVQVNGGVYEATFSTGQEVEIVVRLKRAEEVDAPKSAVMLPAPFELFGPAAEEVLSRETDALSLAWEPLVDADGSVEVEGECIEAATFAVEGEAGGWELPAGGLVAKEPELGGTCTVTATVSFRRDGDADPTFQDESEIAGYQTRQVAFESSP
ncbi:MAG: hypothetical protein R3F14_10070 [Polyangiaceae bacterium]